MNALHEMIVIIVMILLWTVELFYGLLDRNLIIIVLSFLLLTLWFDEFFPIKKDLTIGFNRKIFLTALVVLAQHVLRFFL
jgi:hypothetical protein